VASIFPATKVIVAYATANPNADQPVRFQQLMYGIADRNNRSLTLTVGLHGYQLSSLPRQELPFDLFYEVVSIIYRCLICINNDVNNTVQNFFLLGTIFCF